MELVDHAFGPRYPDLSLEQVNEIILRYMSYLGLCRYCLCGQIVCALPHSNAIIVGKETDSYG